MILEEEFYFCLNVMLVFVFSSNWIIVLWFFVDVIVKGVLYFFVELFREMCCVISM